MQYILTEEEFKALNKERQHEINLSKKNLQELCTKIADTMPVDWKWGSIKNDPKYFKPWGCWITKSKDENYDEWYCDECPVQNICPSTRKPYSQ